MPNGRSRQVSSPQFARLHRVSRLRATGSWLGRRWLVQHTSASLHTEGDSPVTETLVPVRRHGRWPTLGIELRDLEKPRAPRPPDPPALAGAVPTGQAGRSANASPVATDFPALTKSQKPSRRRVVIPSVGCVYLLRGAAKPSHHYRQTIAGTPADQVERWLPLRDSAIGGLAWRNKVGHGRRMCRHHQGRQPNNTDTDRDSQLSGHADRHVAQSTYFRSK